MPDKYIMLVKEFKDCEKKVYQIKDEKLSFKFNQINDKALKRLLHYKVEQKTVEKTIKENEEAGKTETNDKKITHH